MTNLLINIDHVATLRNARKESFPDPVEAATLCTLGGADGIVAGRRGSSFENLLIVSHNDGAVTLIDPDELEVTTMASGGTRGDFVKSGPDGEVYVTQSDQIVVFEGFRVVGPEGPARRTRWLFAWAGLLAAYAVIEFAAFRGVGEFLDPRELSGFERVLVPRLHDARFFLREDRKRTLADRLPALEDVVYHRKLGTLRDKAGRLQELAPRIAELLGLDADRAQRAGRAGLLAKCDLVTLMVGEFPELQGHVGSVYAAADGEHADVAEALDGQYRHDLGDAAQPSGPALALLLAENLDVLCQFGARVGLPTGSADPFGVRRAALTFVDACQRWAPDLPLAAALQAAGGRRFGRPAHRRACARAASVGGIRAWRGAARGPGPLRRARASWPCCCRRPRRR